MPIKNKITRNAFYCYFPIIVLFALIRMLSEFKLLSFLGQTGTYIVNVFIQIGLLFTLSIFMFTLLQKTKVKQTFSFYRFRKISIKSVIVSILIGVIVYFLNVFVAAFFNGILQGFGYKFTSGTLPGSYSIGMLILNLFVTAVLPAVCEETAHRGMLLKCLAPLGKKSAIIISALLFGLLHMNIEQFFYATLIGLLLGYLATVTETIYPAMIIHFMNNAISVFMGYSQVNHLGMDFVFTWINMNLQNNPFMGLLFVVVLIALLATLLYLLIRVLVKDTTVRKMQQLQQELFKDIAREAYFKELEDISQGDLEKKDTAISFEEFDVLYHNKSLDLGHISNLDNMILMDNRKFKMDVITKVLMIGSFILSGAITIFTLIWGIL